MTKENTVQQIFMKRLIHSNPRDNTHISDSLFETLQNQTILVPASPSTLSPTFTFETNHKTLYCYFINCNDINGLNLLLNVIPSLVTSYFLLITTTFIIKFLQCQTIESIQLAYQISYLYDNKNKKRVCVNLIKPN